jgi:hypothetical protein
MKWQNQINHTTLLLEFRYSKIEKARYFLISWHYCKQAQNVGDLEKIKSKTIGICYNNNRIKVATHQQHTITKRIE